MSEPPHESPIWQNENAKPLLEFKNVTKRFGDFIAIDNLNLKIYEGEFFALLGPSGCGKTTIMRMVAGFETVDEGYIYLHGKDISDIPPHKRPINMMFQSYALFPHMSVFENIAFGLKQEKKPAEEINEKVNQMLKMVQLSQFANRKPHQLSGGQKQRVALARSLAKSPKILLLDEPLGALDKKLRERTQFELVDIQEKINTTFIIVTHDQEEAMTVASRIAVMDAGKMIQIDTPQVIYENPNSTYVADFIGNVNLIEVEVVASENDEVIVSMDNNLPPISNICSKTYEVGSKLSLAIRPEKIKISKHKDEDGNHIEGQIIDIGYVGNISTYHIILNNGLRIKTQSSNVGRIDARKFTWNDKVWVNWKKTAGIVLEK